MDESGHRIGQDDGQPLGWTAGTFICLDDYLAGEMQPDPLPSEYMSY